MRAGRLGAAAATVSGVGAAWVLEKALARRWQAGPDALAEAGLSMPPEVEHHFVTTSDGARLHVVEAGTGPPVVLLHGITLGVGIWVRQFQTLPRSHRVVALDQRGHGQSRAGADGYRFERLADDLVEVLEARDVKDAVVVGHSMGGMVLELAALRRAERLGARATGMVLLATDAGPAIPGPFGRPAGVLTARLAWRAARFAEQRGKGVYPGSDLATWGTRLTFGSRPRATDVELARSLSIAVSPRAMGALLGPLLAFDVRAELGRIELPTLVVVGSRDLLTPLRRARQIASCIPQARLEVLAGCGHLVMLERPAELDTLVEEFAREPSAG